LEIINVRFSHLVKKHGPNSLKPLFSVDYNDNGIISAENVTDFSPYLCNLCHIRFTEFECGRSLTATILFFASDSSKKASLSTVSMKRQAGQSSLR